jgi:hypothetical protein
MAEDRSQQRFSEAQLERSVPFDAHRRLRGPPIEALLEAVEERLETSWPKGGRARLSNAERRDATLNALLANLAAAAFNHVDPARFVSIAFNITPYVGLPLSLHTLRRLRDVMAAEGLIEGQSGYRRRTAAEGVIQARRSRLRATPALLEIFVAVGLHRRHLGWNHQVPLIRMRMPDPDVGAEPSEVLASRGLLAELNAQIAATSLDLPTDAWRRIAERYLATPLESAEEDRPLAGDTSATSLYRAFKGRWDHGGRLYGGWWINVPRIERARLRLAGEAVVELDYAQLHPTLLYARVGRRLDFDPYLPPGMTGASVRALGKRTFNRLLNRTPPNGQRDVRLRATPEDQSQLPRGLSFERYLTAFMARLEPIAGWFGTGEGVRLQREDSDLALAVLARLQALGVLGLPVHDSFIVAASHEAALRHAMTAGFKARYGFEPVIR